jgi:aspartate racemase
MRLLGVVGGMSWLSTLEYYRLINEGVQRALGGSHSARLLLSSVEFQPLADAMGRGDWAPVRAALLEEARRLSAAGAQALLIATNTMHLFAEDVERAAGIAVLHIADATGARIREAAVATVGLMGTRASMEKGFYRERLKERFGVDSLTPDEPARARINAIIFDELCAGKFREESRRFVLEQAALLVSRGARGIVLGCTELPLIVKEEDLSVPRFDTLAAHAQAGVSFLVAP